MSVQEKMEILKDTVNGWREIVHMTCKIDCVLENNLKQMELLKVNLEVATSEEDYLVNSVMSYSEGLERLNERFQVQLTKLLADLHLLANKINPDHNL